jgi:stage V sporulation protein G
LNGLENRGLDAAGSDEGMAMEITEVRIKLMEGSADRLQGFCSITFDNSFVVRDLKIIEGASGPFVAMPSRKLTAHCPSCGCKNHLRAAYCNQCGLRLKEDRGTRDSEGRIKLYADIAHPINSACRESIQNRVIAEFRAELERAQQPGYVSRYEDDYFDDEIEPQTWQSAEIKPTTSSPSGASIGTIPPVPSESLTTPEPPQRTSVERQEAVSPPPMAAPPAPHAFPASGNRHPAGGPHSSPAKEGKDKPARPKGEFGAGVFEE